VGEKHSTSMLNKSAIKAFGHAVIFWGIGRGWLELDATLVGISFGRALDVFFGIIDAKGFDAAFQMVLDPRVEFLEFHRSFFTFLHVGNPDVTRFKVCEGNHIAMHRDRGSTRGTPDVREYQLADFRDGAESFGRKW
jgi:hypothetical protein